MLRIKTFVVNPIEVNCYILSDESKEAVVIDNGTFYADEKEALFKYIEDNNLKPVRQILTHAHFDHIFGVGDFYDRYGVKVNFHAEDGYLYFDVATQLRYIIGRTMDVKTAPAGDYLSDDEMISFGNSQLKVLHTPGHSQGSICLYCEQDKAHFCGDSVFKGSIGRTDFEGGNHDQLINSIQQKILTLPDDVVLYPGHGMKTTVAEERRNNPYINA